MSCFAAHDLAEYDRGRRAESDARRIEAHLATCADCGRKLARVRGASETLRAISELMPPTVTTGSTARFEAALRWNRPNAERERPLFSRLLDGIGDRLFEAGSKGLRLSLAGALSLSLIGVGGYALARHRRAMQSASSVAAVQPAVKAVPGPAGPSLPVAAPEHHAMVTLAAGGIRVGRAGSDAAPAPLDPKAALREGDRVIVPPGSRFAFQWGEGSGAVLEGGSDVTLSRLAPKAQEFLLAAGQISVRVGPHQPGESLQVVTPDHRVTVHGTWFVVTVQPKGTQVQVLEGVVGVAALEGDSASTMLTAPSRASFARGHGVAESERALTGKEAATLRQAGEMGLLPFGDIDGVGMLLGGTGFLDVGSDPWGQLVVDGVSFGATPLQVRRPHGRHLVEISRPGFSTIRRWVTVSDDIGELHAALKLDTAKLEITPPEPEEFQALLRTRRRQISACYEHGLKRDPGLAGTVTLEINVGPAGQVLGTRVDDDTLKDPEVINCLRREAAGWSFARARNAKVVYPFVFRAP